jgi:hypothetical protein
LFLISTFSRRYKYDAMATASGAAEWHKNKEEAML